MNPFHIVVNLKRSKKQKGPDTHCVGMLEFARHKMQALHGCVDGGGVDRSMGEGGGVRRGQAVVMSRRQTGSGLGFLLLCTRQTPPWQSD